VIAIGFCSERAKA